MNMTFNDLVRMYDYLMNEYNSALDEFNTDDEFVVYYANSCYIQAQAYLKKSRNIVNIP